MKAIIASWYAGSAVVPASSWATSVVRTSAGKRSRSLATSFAKTGMDGIALDRMRDPSPFGFRRATSKASIPPHEWPNK
jgi:hypothetical protein